MRILSTLVLLAAALTAAYTTSKDELQFAILGDRTGGAVPGVYEEAWKEADRDHPDFVISVGDTIEGGDDLTVDSEWQQVLRTLLPYHRYRIFFTPGNHDVWSAVSARAFEK